MKNKLKVLMLQPIFASYKSSTFDKLAEKYDFTLLHGQKKTTINQAITPYSKAIKSFQYTKNPAHLFFESFSYLFTVKPKVVIHEYALGILSLIPMYAFCRLMGIKFILYSHGYNRFHGFNPDTSWADKYRVFLMKLADATVIYTQTDKNMLGAFADKRKLFVAQNTLDTTELKLIRTHLEREGKAHLKQRLGFTHRYNLTFIGRLLEEKMPEKIIEVFDILNKKLPNQIGIHFVGGGDIAELQRVVAEKKWENSVKFYGPIYDDAKTGEYLFASDMMVIPGSLGLAINHAFMFDCPIVSFAKTATIPFHGPELAYVVENETGFLIPDLSVELMADKILEYLHNEPLQRSMKQAMRYKMENELTIDNMVKGFTDAVSFVLNEKETSFKANKVKNTEGVSIF